MECGSKNYDDEDAYYAENPNGKLDGSDGHWLTSDRENNTSVWDAANQVNLQRSDGYNEYTCIGHRRDFYGWYTNKIDSRGFDNNWPSAANIVAGQVAKLEWGPLAAWVGKDVISFSNAANKAIFENVFGDLRNLYNGPVMNGEAALNGDNKTLTKEQFNIVDPLYKTQSQETINTLTNLAKGNYLYGIGLTASLRFNGDLTKAKDRFSHGGKVVEFYKLQKVYKKAEW